MRHARVTVFYFHGDDFDPGGRGDSFWAGAEEVMPLQRGASAAASVQGTAAAPGLDQ